MRDATELLGHQIVQVLGRIEAAVQQPTSCCDACGCLLRRGEPTCPNCALIKARRTA